MPVNSDLTEAQVREFFTTLSNWGKWGPNDQFGALNYITPQKRAQAAALVREGHAVSMSVPLATQPSPDNPTPVTHLMIQTGAPGETGMVPVPYSADYFAISPHGLANTHLDALCHVFNQGKMYNGYSASDVTSQGARNGAIDALKDGIVSRGVLIDVPRVKGKEWLDPGEAISPADLEAAEQAGSFRVEEGDILFVRTGRHALERAKGPRDSFKEGLAGLGAACLPWLHARKVAALGSDGRVTSCLAATRRSCQSTQSRLSPWVSICSTTVPWTRSLRPVPRARAGRSCWPWLRSSSCVARHRR